MDFEKLLKDAKSDLIDLTLLNPLLNYKIKKSRGVVLKLKNKNLIIKALTEDSAGGISLYNEKLIGFESQEELKKRLEYTKKEAKTFLEEKGVNVLFFAYGAIEWVQEENSDLINTAPIILIPILVDSEDSQDLRIKKNDEDLFENFALKELFKSYGFQYPSMTEDQDIEAYLSQIEDLKKYPLIKNINYSKGVIDIFKTQKYYMYSDLNVDDWNQELKNNDSKLPDMIQKLVDQKLYDDDERNLTLDFLDQLSIVEDPLLVLDADFSQLKAILKAREKKSFVIQGPPGTGKSQTITNIISDLVSKNNKILFISEKKTALDVVKENFKKINLESLILDLHDPDARKTSILKDIEKTIEESENYSEKTDFEEIQYYENKKNLLEIRKSINDEFLLNGIKIEKVIIRLQEIYDEFINSKIMFSNLDNLKNNLQVIDYKKFNKQLENFKKYDLLKSKFDEDELKSIESVHLIERKVIDIAAIEEITASLQGYANNQSNKKEYLNEKITQLLDVLLTNKSFKETLKNINFTVAIGLVINKNYEKPLSYLITIQQNLLNYENIIKNESWHTKIVLLMKMYEESRSIFSLFSKKIRTDHKDFLRRYLREGLDHTRVVELMRVIEKYQKNMNEFRSAYITDRYHKNLLESIDNPFDIEELISRYNQISKLSNIINELGCEEILNDLNFEELADIDPFIEKYIDQNVEKLRFNELKMKCESLLGVNNLSKLAENDFFNLLKNIPKLIRKQDLWYEFNSISNILNDDGLTLFCNQTVSRSSIAYEYIYYASLKRKFDAQYEYVSNMNGLEINNKRNDFKNSDARRKTYSKVQIHKNQSAKVNKLQRNQSENFFTLNKIFKKTRKIPSIRSIINKAFMEVSTIKPIFMMSPLSVAIYTPRRLKIFDYVIFDEASQIKPSEALGAILRSENAIIVGDSMQLPPTRMFDADNSDYNDAEIIDFEDNKNQNDLKDIPSILDYANSIKMSEVALNWHYRSKFSNLITVSNQEFYDNNLIVFPDSRKPKNTEGLNFTYIENGNYDRSGTRKNVNEASVIVNSILEHVNTCPQKSLGVATFSVSQMEAIEDILFSNKENRLLIEKFNKLHLNEPFFIKNLERLQGDERDSIFISVGYGFSKNSASKTINFGPLNQAGGEKRLNVLISRAKYFCNVFSSIHYYDIETQNTKNLGVEKFKKFLKYAETKEIDLPAKTGNDYDSDFERVVANELRKLGYEVDQQVGSSGFRIDLAVKHPYRVDDYLCGIECDGATYHSSLTARERDRIRQELLEGRGWKILRIWSTDWFRNKSVVLENLNSELIKLIGKEK